MAVRHVVDGGRRRALAQTLLQRRADTNEKAGVDVAHEPPAAYEVRVAKELPLMRANVQHARITAN